MLVRLYLNDQRGKIPSLQVRAAEASQGVFLDHPPRPTVNAVALTEKPTLPVEDAGALGPEQPAALPATEHQGPTAKKTPEEAAAELLAAMAAKKTEKAAVKAKAAANAKSEASPKTETKAAVKGGATAGVAAAKATAEGPARLQTCLEQMGLEMSPPQA